MFGDLQPCDLNQIGHALSRVLLFTKFISFHSDLFCHCWSQQEKESLIPLKFITASDFKMPIKSWFHFELSAVNSQTSVLYVIIPYFVKSNEIQIVHVEKNYACKIFGIGNS